MRTVFVYTFAVLKDFKKSLFLIFLLTLFSYLERLPFISITMFILEKILLFSIGAMLIYLLNRSDSVISFENSLKSQQLSSFFLHFMPTAMGAVFGIMMLFFSIIGVFFFFISDYLQGFSFSDTLNAIESLSQLYTILLLLFSLYLSLVFYILFGKLSVALNSHNFKGAFLAILSSFIDFKYLSKTGFKYFQLFFIYSLFATIYYFIATFVLNWIVYKNLVFSPFSLELIVIILGVSIFSVFNIYFLFVSSYFANRSIKELK